MERVWKQTERVLFLLVLAIALAVSLGAAPRVKATEATTETEGTLTTGTVAVTTTNMENVVTNTATVTISSIPQGADTVTFYTYPVIYATYIASTNSFEWHLTDWAKAALTSSGVTEEEALSRVIAALAIDSDGNTNSASTTGNDATEQSVVINELAAYVTANSVTADSRGTFTAAAGNANDNNAYTTATLPVGAYLVIPACDNMAFLNMLVSVDVSGTSGTSNDSWKLESNDAVLKGNVISITKQVTDSDDTANVSATYYDSVDVEIGNTVTYKITVDVPRFEYDDNSKNSVRFRVEDVIPETIALNESSVEVYGIDSNGGRTKLTKYATVGGSPSNPTEANYKVVVENGTNGSGKVMKLQFGAYYYQTFCIYDSTNLSCTYPYVQIEIVYSAELLSGAEAGDNNQNTATLTYYDEDYSKTKNTKIAQAEVYTYGLNLTKYAASSQNNTTLSDASFKIYTLNDQNEKVYLEFVATTTEGVYKVADSTATGTNVLSAITTDSNGIVSLTGLDSATNYYIEESVAPSGYSLNTNYLKLNITAKLNANSVPTGEIAFIVKNEYDSSGTEVTDSNAQTWTAVVDDTSTSNVKMSVTDTKIAALPATGSVGIIVFTIAGVIIMILALVLINSGKSKAKKA